MKIKDPNKMIIIFDDVDRSLQKPFKDYCLLHGTSMKFMFMQWLKTFDKASEIPQTQQTTEEDK